MMESADEIVRPFIDVISKCKATSNESGRWIMNGKMHIEVIHLKAPKHKKKYHSNEGSTNTSSYLIKKLTSLTEFLYHSTITFKVCVLVLSSTRKAFRVFRNLFSYVQNNTWSISWACRFISLPSIPFQLRDRVWVELLYLCACLTTITTHFGVRCTKTQRPGTATHHINSHSTNPAISSGARLHYACLALHAASGGTVRHSTLDNAKCQGGAPA